jgi:hypothetical protein
MIYGLGISRLGKLSAFPVRIALLLMLF